MTLTRREKAILRCPNPAELYDVLRWPFNDPLAAMGRFSKWRSLVDGEEISAIPDSVEYQIVAQDFADPWPFAIGNLSMSVNGLSESTFSNNVASVFGDGIDDYGAADGPQDMWEYETLGVAFTIEYSNLDQFDRVLGSGIGGESRVSIRGGDSGAINHRIIDDNDNRIEVETSSTFDDGNAHLFVINKLGDNADDLVFYVDDMENEESLSIETDSGFNHENYSNPFELFFWAFNSSGDPGNYGEFDAGIFEFNSEPYTESERDGLLSRRPEVS